MLFFFVDESLRQGPSALYLLAAVVIVQDRCDEKRADINVVLPHRPGALPLA